MKLPLIFLCMSSVCVHAAFESWTNKEGKAAELDLLSVSESNGEKIGEFKMRNGRKVSLKSSDLAEEDAKRLEAFAPPAKAGEEAPASFFDSLLDGNLVTLQGRSLKSYKEGKKPTKYYLFYYTASWCGPCQKFTPTLVEFYDKAKPGNDEFEIVLITSDSSEEAMEGYAKDKKMAWPMLKLARTEKFKKTFKHQGTGIPNLVLTDLQGNILKQSYEGGKYLGPHVVMEELKQLLSQQAS